VGRGANQPSNPLDFLNEKEMYHIMIPPTKIIQEIILLS
jgi:hypothetical protein